jgi:hypothetical protein
VGTNPMVSVDGKGRPHLLFYVLHTGASGWCCAGTKMAHGWAAWLGYGLLFWRGIAKGCVSARQHVAVQGDGFGLTRWHGHCQADDRRCYRVAGCMWVASTTGARVTISPSIRLVVSVMGWFD